MKKLAIFDGNSIMNRAFYGVRPLSNREGLQTNAVYGYVNILKKHLDTIRPDYAAVAFDLKAPTFRHKFYADYKGTRSPMKEELVMQVPYVHEVTRLMGIPTLELEGYEADDILGTMAKKANDEGVFAYIVTGDRDSFQLVSENTTVILASTSGDEKYTPEKLAEKYGGLSPRQLIDVKAIMGDSSDNIPGVRGIGEKGAVNLISEAGSLENLYDNLDSFKLSDSMRNKLIEGRDSAKMSRFLAEIKLDVPSMPSLCDIEIRDMLKEELRELFIKLEFHKMIKSFGLIESPDSSANEKTGGDDMQISFSEPSDESDEPITESSVTELAADDFSALDGDTIFAAYDENGELFLSKDDAIFKISGDRMSLLYRIRPVVFSYKDFCRYFADLGGDIERFEAAFDLSTAAYLVNPGDSTDELSKLSLIYLKRPLDSRLAKDPAFALPIIKKLYSILPEEIERLGMHELYYNIELPLSKVLAKAEIAGFKVDPEGLASYGEKLKAGMSALEQGIYAEAGTTFNINSPKQLGEVLFERLGLPHFKKTKTGYSTNAETLEKLSGYPIVGMVLEYRGLSKLYGTYVEGLLKQVGPDGRIHTRFLQTQTQTGRLSSVEPNLQNIPIRTEQGRELRRFFTAEDGSVLVDADYSQIELRILAHISGDDAFITAFRNGIDIHTKTASEIFHTPIDEVTPEMRKSAKAVNFGIVYGIGEYSLSNDIKTSRAQAAAYIERYFETYPKVREYLERTKAEAHRNGFVTTLFGRRRYIPELSATKKPMIAFGERVAMNTPIQGTAADVIKLAMVAVDRRLSKEGLKSRLIMQVHDELILECPENEAEYAEKLLKEEMENAVKFDVLLRADVGRGRSWYEAH